MIDTPAAMALAKAYYEVFQSLGNGNLSFGELSGQKVEDALRLSKKLELIDPLAKKYLPEFKALAKEHAAAEEELEIDRHINAHYDGPHGKIRPAPSRDASRKAIAEAKLKEAKVKK